MEEEDPLLLEIQRMIEESERKELEEKLRMRKELKELKENGITFSEYLRKKDFLNVNSRGYDQESFAKGIEYLVGKETLDTYLERGEANHPLLKIFDSIVLRPEMFGIEIGDIDGMSDEEVEALYKEVIGTFEDGKFYWEARKIVDNLIGIKKKAWTSVVWLLKHGIINNYFGTNSATYKEIRWLLFGDDAEKMVVKNSFAEELEELIHKTYENYILPSIRRYMKYNGDWKKIDEELFEETKRELGDKIDLDFMYRYYWKIVRERVIVYSLGNFALELLDHDLFEDIAERLVRYKEYAMRRKDIEQEKLVEAATTNYEYLMDHIAIPLSKYREDIKKSVWKGENDLGFKIPGRFLVFIYDGHEPEGLIEAYYDFKSGLEYKKRAVAASIIKGGGIHGWKTTEEAHRVIQYFF